MGIALDAATRGYSVALFERFDFAKGTSSRSTKLVHGGVRYLAQGNVSLVREALHERSTVLHSAPHLAQPLSFLMPCYRSWQIPFYWTGLKLYDSLSGSHSLGKTKILNRSQTKSILPNVRSEGLTGSIQYWDGQFDDARLALAIARTAAQNGAKLLNYCEVLAIEHVNGKARGALVKDLESGQSWSVQADCIVNATGVWVDELRSKDDQSAQRAPQPMVAPSQGIHLTVDRSFMKSNHALIIPKTSDGRVLFAVPWLGKIILGTTDTPRHEVQIEPRALKNEIDFILRESANYLEQAPGTEDIRSIWVGLRPLVKPTGDSENTKSISREHTIVNSPSGLVTVTGGKWTTYRVMADDAIKHCVKSGLLDYKGETRTTRILMVGSQSGATIARNLAEPPGLTSYGDEKSWLANLPGHDHLIADGLTESMIRFAARYEYARTVEDILARRHRMLFLDARLAEQCIDEVSSILQAETGVDPQAESFRQLCEQYRTIPNH